MWHIKFSEADNIWHMEKNTFLFMACRVNYFSVYDRNPLKGPPFNFVHFAGLVKISDANRLIKYHTLYVGSDVKCESRSGRPV